MQAFLYFEKNYRKDKINISQQEYFAKLSDLSSRYLVSAIDKRGIFNEVKLIDSSVPKSVPMSEYSYKLYLQFTHDNGASWYIQGNNHEDAVIWSNKDSDLSIIADSVAKLICSEFEEDC